MGDTRSLASTVPYLLSSDATSMYSPTATKDSEFNSGSWSDGWSKPLPDLRISRKFTLRILAVVLVPIAILMGVLISNVVENERVEDDLQALRVMADISKSVSQYMLEVQKERGLSALYLANHSDVGFNQLILQRQIVDESRRLFVEKYFDDLRHYVGESILETASLLEVSLLEARNLIQRNSTDNVLFEAFDIYTTMISELIGFPYLLLDFISDSEGGGIGYSISMLINSLIFTEGLAVERGIGGLFFLPVNLKPTDLYLRYVKARGKQEATWIFLAPHMNRGHTPESTAAYLETIPWVSFWRTEIESMSTIANATELAVSWFSNLTIILNYYAETQLVIVRDIEHMAKHLIEESEKDSGIGIGLMVGGITLSLFILYFVIQSTGWQVRYLKDEIIKAEESIARFVPKRFLRLLGCSNISEITAGHRLTIVLTVMFLDIRNFTTLSENMTEEETFSWLMEFLAVMSPIITKHDGFIDKYLGDGIMAIFLQPAHAIFAAVEMKIVRSQVFTMSPHNALI
eukprot:TRINITY_DN1947_c0_g1_i19.p1 TRINITY_DN1947_c0_g1~~TRINITY_DN1947_c0_g1_i19.p1  ORF type:complete len:519 (+),score=97.47 TRINITY_DN1947_c0_g1_i19:102-1658(+)